MKNTYSLDEFKTLIKSKNQIKKDFVDFEHGKIIVHRENLDKYLEKYACRNEDDFSNTMWYSYGCLVKVIE